MTARLIRVLVVNDSPTVRASLRLTLARRQGFEVIGELDSAERVVESVRRLHPDVVLMDVVMPGADGWTATRALMAQQPVPILLVSQVVDPRDARMALEAIRAGALAIVEPPPSPNDRAQSLVRESFLALVRSAAHVRPRATQRIAEVQPLRARAPAALIALVASTGGPAAVVSVLEALPVKRFAPLVLVQHMARGFVSGLARWLATTGHPIVVVEHGARPERGHVYVAPEDRHLGVSAAGALILSDEAPVGQFRPSGTYLLSTMARSLGRRGAAAVLTGMGEDGAEGAVALQQAGGEVVAQDEESAVVFGMPQAALQRGAVSEVLTLSEIARWILEKSGAE